jgi:hypothetical protein
VVRIFGEYGPHFTFIRGNLEPGSILFGFLEKLRRATGMGENHVVNPYPHAVR